MALPNAYLVTTKNLDAFLKSIQSAKAPERFTNKFLAQLDFSSSNDRLLIGVLKALKFIDDNGVPTQRYFEFLDQGQSGRVLADGIRDAYSDLFNLNKNAQTLTVDEIKNKLKTLTLGQKSDNVVSLMANTFKTLSDLADWKAASSGVVVAPTPPDTDATEKKKSDAEAKNEPKESHKVQSNADAGVRPLQLHYDIQIHLPESRDAAVYDAIFAAPRKHLP
ncbi:MAG TPA: DUF5343 domain-containing protein [Terriglobia bacterium]|nr:DUF5343 domain-containing protein [Terriglobia bacterium]